MKPITKDTACFFTQQLFIIGTYNEDDSAHFAPFSWVSFTAGPPCCLILSISGQKRKKETVKNIERTGRFSATIATPELLAFVEQNNKATSKEGLILPQEFYKGSAVDVPLIKGTKWSYECEVVETVHIGCCHTFFGAYQQVNVSEDIQKLDFIDLREINPVIYSDSHYFTVGEHLGAIGDYSKE